MIDQEIIDILYPKICHSAEVVREMWWIKNGHSYSQKELVWYMPGYFIEVLKKQYYKSIGMITVPDPPQLMGIEIREGYEPCIVLTSRHHLAFTRPELTIRGENLVKYEKPIKN